MKKMILATALISVFPVLATAEMKMQNNNPTAAPSAEPTLGHHMQNSDPTPDTLPTPEHVMKNSNPKKFVSSNAGTLEEKHSGK